jgi:hypothetical protein
MKHPSERQQIAAATRQNDPFLLKMTLACSA